MAVNFNKGDTRMARMPQWVSTMALNGHMTLYRVISMDAQGRLTTSQWGSAHYDANCTCVPAMPAEPLSAYAL